MVKTAALAFRVEEEVKVALEKAATADGRSVSNLTDRIVREWLTSAGYLEASGGNKVKGGWYVEAYQKGLETAEEVAAAGEWFATFEPALSRLKELRAAGAEPVRIKGPTSATDRERAAIVAEGGFPTFD